MPPNSPTPFQFHEALDAVFLHDLFADDFGYAVTVFDDVLAELPGHWLDLEVAFETDNLPAFKAIVHKCKTLYAYVGFSSIRKQLQWIEQNCNTVSHTITLQAAFDNLRREHLEAEQVIISEINRLKQFHEK